MKIFGEEGKIVGETELQPEKMQPPKLRRDQIWEFQISFTTIQISRKDLLLRRKVKRKKKEGYPLTPATAKRKRTNGREYLHLTTETVEVSVAATALSSTWRFSNRFPSSSSSTPTHSPPLSLSSLSWKPLPPPSLHILKHSRHCKSNHLSRRLLKPSFAVAESSDSPQPIGPSLQSLLEDLANTFHLPQDYFAQLPRDLRLDLNDAAFDLSNRRVLDESGQELGETLLNLSRAWELADTSASHALASKLPELEGSLTESAKSGKS